MAQLVGPSKNTQSVVLGKNEALGGWNAALGASGTDTAAHLAGRVLLGDSVAYRFVEFIAI